MPGIKIVKDERIGPHTVATCENCGELRELRRVEAFSFISGASRGWYRICFVCFKPRIFWYERGLKQAKAWESPAPGEISHG